MVVSGKWASGSQKYVESKQSFSSSCQFPHSLETTESSSTSSLEPATRSRSPRSCPRRDSLRSLAPRTTRSLEENKAFQGGDSHKPKKGRIPNLMSPSNVHSRTKALKGAGTLSASGRAGVGTPTLANHCSSSA